MTDAEKCKEEILQIMQKYNCRFVLDWDEDLHVQDKQTYEDAHLTGFKSDAQ